MITQKIKLTALSICGLMLIPFAAQASTATLINDTTVLFAIDFSFTDELFNVSVPIAAEYGATYEDRIDTVGFTVESEDTEANNLKRVHAAVLSTAPISDTRYTLSKGTTGTFSLIVLAEFETPISNTLQSRITKLPYFLDERRTTVHQNQLDELHAAILEL